MEMNKENFMALLNSDVELKNNSVTLVGGGAGDSFDGIAHTDFNGLDYGFYKDYIKPNYSYWPEHRYHTVIHEDKYERAFKIAKMLLTKELLISRKVKDFIGLVEMIANEI